MNAIATTEPNQVSTTSDHAMTLANIIRHVELVQHVLEKVMKRGTHYGESFPGDKKQNLLKPGADKLCLAFQLSPSFEVDERPLAGDHREYRVTCKLTTPGGRLMGEGVGTCSTMESKYRWRNAKAKCPDCQKETVIKTSRGYWCPPDKGGCGANPLAPAIENQVRGKTENPDIADVYNTCLKIGKKRAYVDATITATAASDLFTQDAEDLAHNAEAAERTEAAKRPQQQSAAPAKEATQTAPPKAAAGPDVKPAVAASVTTPAAQKGTSVHSSTPKTSSTTSTESATGSSRPDTMSLSAPKPDCQIWHSALAKLTDPKLALDVWQESCRSDQGGTWQVRFDTLKDMVLAIETIHQVLGEQKSREVVADIAREINHDVPGIQMIRKELIRASNGELATAQAPAGPAPDEDQPPF